MEWDQQGFVVAALRREGLNDTEIARLLSVTPRTVKRRRARVTECGGL
jgi:DNA-binding NarL/FixJ family response regulator